MGTVFGAVAMFGYLGMALGPWGGGYVFDTYGSYAWLYIGSFASGLALSPSLSLSARHVPRRCSST